MTQLGRAAIEEMYHGDPDRHQPHARGCDPKTFDLLGELDRESVGRRNYPVIATHAAFRFGNPTLEPDACDNQADHRSRSVIGLIFAQHRIVERLYKRVTNTLEESLPILKRHVDEIRRHGGRDVLTIGSDFDGFIKPTLGGFDHIDDLAKLGERLDELLPRAMAKASSGDALRVLETTFTAGTLTRGNGDSSASTRPAIAGRGSIGRFEPSPLAPALLTPSCAASGWPSRPPDRSPPLARGVPAAVASHSSVPIAPQCR